VGNFYRWYLSAGVLAIDALMCRIACYTICLNEQKFAQRWLDTTKDADYVLVADTGSTDKTLDILSDIDVVSIAVKPFRFDDCRNSALNLLPADLDVVIALDMDETLTPGWRQKIEKVWTPTTTRLRYGYVWSWTSEGQPDLVFQSDKISGRFTHRWKAPVHEVLHPTVPEVFATIESVLIEHHPDSSKSRGQYLSLLKLAVIEDPFDDRNSHYLGREYFYHQLYAEAITELHRHLSLPRALWKAERAASMRYIAKCHECLGEAAQAHEWFVRATLEDPSSREALIDVARHALAQNAFYATISYCQVALALPVVVGDYMAERYARTEGAHDLMAVALSHIGQQQEAIKHARTAVALNPHDLRLVRNLRMMEE
jgi:glycosyltransferase involved in cell wall biosynthesis